MNTNPNAKRILFFGDSFTFGRLTGTGRFDSKTRFTGVVQDNLWSDYEIIEEWLRARTLSGENKFFHHRDGLESFDGIVGSHFPLNLVVIFLGTNDMNTGFDKTAEDMEMALSAYLQKLQEWWTFFNLPAPKVLLVCPPFVNDSLLPPAFVTLFGWAEAKSRALPGIYKAFAEKNWIAYFDSNEIVQAGDVDGVHIDAESHKKLGDALSQVISNIWL